MAIIKKSLFIVLAVVGLLQILLSVAPYLLDMEQKGFGLVQILFLKNGLVFLTAGLIPLFFPRFIDYMKNKFNDSQYQIERSKLLAGRISISKHDVIVLLFFLVIANLFAIHIIRKENYIYFWDAANYWSKYVEINELFKSSPLRAIVWTLTSIQVDHYNYFAPFLLMPFSLFFGVERLSYILSLVNLFLFPAAVVFLLLYKRTGGILSGIYGNRLPLSTIIITLFTFFAFPFVWTPLLDGYVGIGGFIIIGLIFFVYFKYPFPAQRYGSVIVMGILVSILVIFRQWYSFWALSFFIALIVNELIFLFVEYRFEQARLWVLSKKIFLTIFASGFFYVMIAGPFLLKIIFGDYSYLSLTYNFSDTAYQHFIRFLRHFGLLYVSLMMFGVFVSFYISSTRKLASFLFIQWIVMFLLFTRVHSFLPHHYYLLQPTMLLFIALFMTAVLLKLRSNTFKIAVCFIYIVITTISFSSAFFPKVTEYTKQAKALFPTQRYYPLVRNDMTEIKRMLDVLGGLLADPNDRLYVLASSSVLNSEMIEMAHLSLPDTKNIKKQVFRSSNLDLKDGFPHNFFKARYILIADPIQYDFDPKKARVITIPAESILNSENMGTSYRRLPYEFNLDKGVKAYIYERNGSFNQSDVDFLSDALRKYYPDKPFVYRPNMERS